MLPVDWSKHSRVSARIIKLHLTPNSSEQDANEISMSFAAHQVLRHHTSMYYSCGGSEAVGDGKFELTHRAQVPPHSSYLNFPCLRFASPKMSYQHRRTRLSWRILARGGRLQQKSALYELWGAIVCCGALFFIERLTVNPFLPKLISGPLRGAPRVFHFNPIAP